MYCGVFVQSEGCLFTFVFLLMLYTLMKDNLSVFPFMGSAFSLLSKKSLPTPRSQRSSFVSSKSFIDFAFTFTFMIHLELISEYGIREGLRLGFFPYEDIQFFQHYILINLSFCHEITSVHQLKHYLGLLLDSILLH